MSSPRVDGTPEDPIAPSAAVDEVAALHRRILDAWNHRDADGLAALFAPAGNLVGFDGSSIDGPEAIRQHLEGIFADHEPASYVAKVREVRTVGQGVVLLRAVAGMVPPGGDDINPDVNAVQSLVAVTHDRGWRAALYQNTPAAFHGRPEAARALTEELRKLLTDRSET
jgi:uncharacterized protein (TIGR02246 family)